jgi:phytoene dehydrogenase-like protein
MEDQVIVVGGGIAGLTAAAYLCKAGLKVLLCEKEQETGGLVRSFVVDGFTFDGGIRAIENSGVVLPMLRQLGIEVPFRRSGVSIGIGTDCVNLQDKASLHDYLALLGRQFPDNRADIARFGREIEKIMGYMDVLYGIDNPLFMDLKNDRRYLMQTLLPWLFKYLLTIGKINRLNLPVTAYLQKISANQALIDLIAQHFFQDTPTFFALSYFSLYLDYQYPVGGTGTLSDALAQFIRANQGEIRCETEIARLDARYRQVWDTKGQAYPYQKLIWAADMKRLYQVADIGSIKHVRVHRAFSRHKNLMADKIGGDSVLTVFVTCDLDKQYFASIAQAHFFYTPDKTGLSGLESAWPADGDRQTLWIWLSRYLHLTTYEISCPALRDEHLAPAGQTGLIISTLFDHALTRIIADRGWYDDFKDFCAQTILDVLQASIYPDLRGKVMRQIVSTPLTLARMTGNSDGAITGWSFTRLPVPAVSKMAQIARSVLTPIPDVCQAGQWTFSPSGLPISILTGKLAADQVLKNHRT